MASIKEAVENAVAFAEATLGSERTIGIRLEEVESGSMFGEDAWLITLSMISADEPLGIAPLGVNMAKAFGSGKREYKSFTVRKRDGEVLSMKIRELADA